MIRIRTRLVCLMLLLLATLPATAQIPRTINYQGSLKAAADNSPITGSKAMTFELFDVLTGGTHLWTETQTVAVTDGIYSVILGSSVPLNLAFDKQYYLQVSVNGTALEPRQQLTSVPYAHRAAQIDGITVNNGKVGIGTTNPAATLHVAGPITFSSTPTLLFNSTTESGAPVFDGFRLRYDQNFFGSSLDALVIEKTDGNEDTPDGGVAFVNTGADEQVDLALAIRGNGNVGIGTATPSQKLDVAGNATISGNTNISGTLHVQSYEQAWNGAGSLDFFLTTLSLDSTGGTAVQYPYIEWRRNGERGAYLGWGDHGSYIQFQLESGNDLAIRGGNVGVGTTTPQYPLDVVGTIRGTTVTSSDARLKTDIAELDGSLARLVTLRGTQFRMKTPVATPDVSMLDAMNRYAALTSASARKSQPENDRLSIGVIAQEVEQVFPEAVFTDATGYKSVAYDMLIAPLIEAVKELKAENDSLRAEIESLNAQHTAFERRLQALEAAK